MGNAGIVAFAFGTPCTILANKRIAEIAAKKSRELNAPVYTQLDVCIEAGIRTTYTQEDPGNPPPTLPIAQGAIRWANQQGVKELWIVAAKPHLWRALRDTRQAIREAKAQIGVHVCTEIEQYPEDSWFCPDSGQTITQSRKSWERRDRAIKLMPFFLYRMVSAASEKKSVARLVRR